MKVAYFGLLSLFIFLFPETINSIPINAIDLSEFDNDNESLSSSRSNNTSIEVLELHGAMLIDGTGRPPKADTDIIISGNKIVAVTNQTGFLDSPYINDFDRMQSRVSFLNLSGKYVMPGLLICMLTLPGY